MKFSSVVFLLLLGSAFAFASASEDGPESGLANWVEDLRDNLFGSDSFVNRAVRKLRHDVNLGFKLLMKKPSTKIGAVIPAGAPIPEEGYEFELPADVASMSLSDFQRTRLGAIPENNFESEADRLSEESDILMQMTAEEYVRAVEPTLPSDFSWYDRYPKCMSKPWNQGSCGSCWSFAITNAGGLRLCGAMADKGWEIPKDFRLSPQKLVSCATKVETPSGDSCSGGYTYKGSMLFDKLKIPEMSCFPYVSGPGDEKDELCQKSSKCSPLWDIGAPRRIHAVSNAKARFTAIKKELYKNGPLVTTMRVPATFMGYNGQGVYSKGSSAWLMQGQQHSWHAVTIVGYGSKPKPHLLIENSWGSTYHKMPSKLRGHFRIDADDSCLHMSTEVLALGVSLSGVSKPKRASKPIYKPDNNDNNRGNNNYGSNTCASDWSNGKCYRTTKCPSGTTTIWNPTKKGCPSNNLCCKGSGSSAPKTKCQARHGSGAKCIRSSTCSSYGRSSVSGLCPGSSAIKCCLPRGISGVIAGESNEDDDEYDAPVVGGFSRE